jgi:hypothetical protein
MPVERPARLAENGAGRGSHEGGGKTWDDAGGHAYLDPRVFSAGVVA